VVQHSGGIESVFAALADPTRRSMISRLGWGPASVGDLARTSAMTLPSFMKHVRTLEASGLIHTSKVGRVRTCTLDRERLTVVDGWLAEQRAIWEGRTDRLEQFVTSRQDSRQEQT
jgi:DNA-binding transcriptional ArsR family regulator